MSTRSDAAKILFVYESAMFRHSIVRSLSECEDMTVVASIGTSKEARRYLRSMEVDAVIIGISLPDGSGFDLCKEIKSRDTAMKVVLLSPTDDEDTFLAAVRTRADGYVLKSSPYAQFLTILRSVLAGNCTYDPIICSLAARRLAKGPHSPEQRTQNHFDAKGLSPRERQVLEMMSKGMTNKVIANELGISISTTKTHVTRIFKELNISSRGELMPRLLNFDGMDNE